MYKAVSLENIRCRLSFPISFPMVKNKRIFAEITNINDSFITILTVKNVCLNTDSKKTPQKNQQQQKPQRLEEIFIIMRT